MGKRKKRGGHTTVIDSRVEVWLEKFGEIAPGVINFRTSSVNYLRIKKLDKSDWYQVTIAANNVQEIRFLPEDPEVLPWEQKIPKNITKRYTIKNHLSNSSDEEE